MSTSRSHPARTVLSGTAVATMGLGALLGGCSSGDDSSSGTTAAPSTTGGTSSTAAAGTAAPSTTAGSGGAGSLPTAPSGAQELQTANGNGVNYARYSISGTTAQQVVSDYQSELQSAGWSVNDTGGGGNGWGKWGGAGAGLNGTGSGGYVSVQAGGQNGGPVYFEVCQGTNSSSVQECGNQSQGPDNQNNQNNQKNQKNQNNNDSNSGGS